jgi:hypothetical protein
MSDTCSTETVPCWDTTKARSMTVQVMGKMVGGFTCTYRTNNAVIELLATLVAENTLEGKRIVKTIVTDTCVNFVVTNV